MTPEEVKAYVGQQVTLHLTPHAPGGPTVKGRLVETLDAADGLVAYVEPEGSPPGSRFTCHYHYIASISAAF